MKFISFYLPQYHPIPENDAWWGKDFTDWVNVKKCLPRFKSHHQPHVPSELGYYDLRDPAIRSAQANLAQSHGIDAFCYYHYWFNGKLLLEQPLNAVLESKEPDFPFCVCWANENWTRAWDGQNKQVLMAQNYSLDDDKKHIQWFISVFKDKRYILIDGKPLLLIYKTSLMPNLEATLSFWKQECVAAGFKGLYVCSMRSKNFKKQSTGVLAQGVDALVDFQPTLQGMPTMFSSPLELPLLLKRMLFRQINIHMKRKSQFLRMLASRHIPYSKVIARVQKLYTNHFRQFPCVYPTWDNSPRREHATIIQNDDPEEYARWLTIAAEKVKNNPKDEQLVFINAWNEWAEGCHLEPDERLGRAFLEKTRGVRTRFKD